MAYKFPIGIGTMWDFDIPSQNNTYYWNQNIEGNLKVGYKHFSFAFYIRDMLKCNI